MSLLININSGILSQIKTQTDKLAGAAPVTGSVTQDWQTAEADVVSIGEAGVSNKVQDLSLNISNMVGALIIVRLYKNINGVERNYILQAYPHHEGRTKVLDSL